MTAPVVLPPIVPENAPFNPEQRAWLNGFFAGLLSLDGGVQALSRDAAQALLGSPLPGEQMAEEEDDDAPWHDPSMPIDERMTLADGKPLKKRMFAAMAQQDCGQCGYLCDTYSAALASGEEKKLNLCVPGGKETQRMLKKLATELGGAPAAEKPAADEKAPAAPAATEPGRSREAPVEAKFLSKIKLNADGSDKETNHVEIDLSECGLTYQPGDSFGLFAINCPELAGLVAKRLEVSPDEPVTHDGETMPLSVWLSEKVCLGAAPDALFELLKAYAESADDKAKLARLAEGEDPDGDLATLDVLAALEKFQDVTPPVPELLGALEPLQPRLYSISSALSADPGRVSLTVDTVRYRIADRMRKGLASTYLGDRVEPGAKLKVYVQKAHGFGLPMNGETPIIMVGPGTGVAPFRSFLRERRATGAKGDAWLFFGHQREATDFFYREELEELKAAGALKNLSLAWSRDGESKVYVQDRMRESGAELWSWLERGAHFYVCGDAKRMAADVEKALIDIAAEHGAKGEAAKAFVADLKKAGRYQADVY